MFMNNKSSLFVTITKSKATGAGFLFASAFIMLVFACLPAQAGGPSKKAAPIPVREAAPEDAINCCIGDHLFLFNNDQVLTSTGRAGIFRSDNRGEVWQRSMNGFVGPSGASPFPDVMCQSPSQPQIVYALAGLGPGTSSFNGFLVSSDFGATWSRRGSVNTGFGTNLCAVDAADPRTVYLSGFDDETFDFITLKSTDGAQTFQPLPNLPTCDVNGFFLRSVQGAVYFFGGPQCSFFSTDHGNSFHQINPPASPNGGFDVSPDGHAVFFAAEDDFFQPTGTFRSTDQGATFVPVNGLPFGFAPLAFDPTNSLRIYATDGVVLYISSDSGLNFDPLPASNDPRFPGFFPIPAIGIDSHGSVYLDTLTGPYRTDDGGQTFRSIETGDRASSVNGLAFDANGKLLAAVLHTQVLFRQTSGPGLNFESIGTTPAIQIDSFTNDATAVAPSPTDANVILLAMSVFQGLFRTNDGGRSWTQSTLADNPYNFQNARMAFATSSRVYLVSPVPPFFQPGLYRSDDAGQNFAHLSTLQFGAIAVDRTNADVLYIGTYNSGEGLFKSTDGGQTLQNLNQPGSFSAIAIDRTNSQTIYAGQLSGGVIRSTDGGATFVPASDGLGGVGVIDMAQDSDGTLFVWMKEGGLFSSHDRGTSWQFVDAGEAFRRSEIDAGRGSLVIDPLHPGRVYLGNPGVIQITAGNETPPTSGNTCNGTFGGTFNGNLTISNTQVCDLVNATVNGNITVNPGGTLILDGGNATGNVQGQGGKLVLNAATIDGNVQINGGSFTIGPETTINKNVDIQNTPQALAHNQVCGATINGNLRFHNNGGAVDIGAASCAGNLIGGNLQVQNNNAPVTIFANTISKNLQCSQNSPAPNGGSNVAKSDQGQCAGF
jgi:hypothetical protein